MSDGTLVADLIRAGVDADLIQRVANAIGRGDAAIRTLQDQAAAQAAEAEARLEAKRAANAERQRRFRESRNAGNALCGVTGRDERYGENVPPHPPITTPRVITPSDPKGSSAPKGVDQAEGHASDAPTAVASAKRPRAARKHLCPAGFAPKDRHYAAVEARGYAREFADREAIRMHRWSNGAGRPSCFKSDWDLTFDNWLEKAMDDLDSRPQRGAPPPSSTSPPSNGGFSFLNRSIRETYRNGQSDRAPEFDLQPNAGGGPVVQLRRAYG